MSRGRDDPPLEQKVLTRVTVRGNEFHRKNEKKDKKEKHSRFYNISSLLYCVAPEPRREPNNKLWEIDTETFSPRRLSRTVRTEQRKRNRKCTNLLEKIFSFDSSSRRTAKESFTLSHDWMRHRKKKTLFTNSVFVQLEFKERYLGENKN